MNLPEDINQAIEHYNAGVATAAERKLLQEFYASFETESTEVDADTLAGRAQLEAQSLAYIHMRIRKARTFSIYKKLAVAAAVLAIAAIAYFWFRPSPPALQLADHAPGTLKATLTLANGAQIALDDAANGHLAEQNGVKIMKVDSGRLAYAQPSANSGMLAYNILSTPRGGQYQVDLPDGTRAWLNAASSIRYPVAFSGEERRVEITGEVYFEVAGNAGQPFVVKAREAMVEVLGTRFNVMAYKEEPAIQTTLLEGAVRIGQTVLKPGQQGALGVTGVWAVREVDTRQATAWLHGQLSMKYLDVAAFMRQVSRWYDVDVVFEGNIPEMSFSGSISRSVHLSLVIKALNDNGLPVEWTNGKLIVKGTIP
ncbi:FecR family protein [Chitinophaga sp. XS-30]|uniref:FecR family protein n=1 Tax=Chitinophaga sp. XS-30 TaxID=2604421 RepID=UPI0011DDF5CF|nr:FecR family protein [Chitinophaga sp. XS-30]QEH40099.1 DUF4974 domain-containing protein [Chitinophaga sp. XS-30]